MNQIARVISTGADGFAVVEVVRSSACEACHKHSEGGCAACSLIGGNKTMRTRAKNTAGAVPGDTVRVEAGSARTIGYAVLAFIFPLLAATGGYMLAALLRLPDGICVLCGAGGFVLAFALLYLYSRLVISRRCDIEITAIIEKPDSTEETAD